MPAVHQHRNPWTPISSTDKAAVRRELDSILRSSHFCNSKRYPALLRYLVENTLEGHTSQIKERTLGIEVFGRAASYDTNSDTVVRYTAGEVRRRLAMYYHEHEDAAVQIVLPIGSYVPEFLRIGEEPGIAVAEDVPATPAAPEPEHPVAVPTSSISTETPAPERLPGRSYLRIALLVGCVALLAAATVAGWYAHARRAETAVLDRFWKPIAHEAQPPLLVAGGVVFSPNLYSGTQTASRLTDYPFVSMQIASAMARVSGVLQKEGTRVDTHAANSATLSDLRDRPIILVGGYNNDWTVRLLNPLPFRLNDASDPAILETGGAQRRWQRDRDKPYNTADDYALVGRYRDATTGSLSVIIAGLGRNGSEAAAQFLTEPHYLQELEEQLGHRIDDRNIEAVLHVRVIEGRTGAPSILAVRTW